MSSFQEIQKDLQAARKGSESTRKSVFRSTEHLKRLQHQKAQALRSAGRDSRTYQALLGREAELKETLATDRAKLEAALTTARGLFADFEPFTDPRQHLNRLSDDFPILFFPVRLETRFKAIERGSRIRRQLWVRIFPDDCSIDTFDDTLSEAELEKARGYWANLWKIGEAGSEAVKDFVAKKAKGTWHELMGTFNAGRAYWIKENYVPVNASDMPKRNDETEKILVIPTDDPPDPATRDALKAYWAAVFTAQGDANDTANSLATLITTLGISEEAASALIQTYRPENLDLEEAGGGPAPPVQAEFLIFEPRETVDTKLASWSQAARVTTLPERFVLLGYQQDRTTAVINELGAPVPDPLIVGPDPSMDIDAVLRSVHGPAFDGFTDDEKAERYIEYLSGQSETKWLFDFDEAIRIGMGFKVDISEAIHRDGLQRLFVIGVKLSASESDAKAALEELLAHHHFGDSGLSILPQGIPTNNTEDSKSGYAATEDADEAYEHYHQDPLPDDPPDPALKRDGRWLAELLGIDVEPSTLNLVPGYYRKDQCEARAMNTALWNATLGYFMESMLTPVFTDQQRSLARWFLINHVSGRGRLPAVRIADQPYGILPATTFSEMPWLDHDDDDRFSREFMARRRGLSQIRSVVQRIREDWAKKLDSVAYVGKGGGADAHEVLLQALGLHANSVEFDQRYAESFEHHYNMLLALGLRNFANLLARLYRESGKSLLAEHGYVHDEKLDPEIPILERFFLTKEHDVKKPLIDDRELSEVEKIRPYTDSGDNYIEWLIEHAKNDHRNIKDQKGFIDNKAPYALLYDMLRHALNLQFANTALNFYEAAEILGEKEVSALRVDPPFVGIQAQPTQLQSKWDLIYRPDTRIADDGAFLVDHISNLVRTSVVNSQTRDLHDVISALELLKDAPTAKLERVFVEHLDLCTYRLDAWLLGLVDAQLQAMRFQRRTAQNGMQQGIYLGAFGWLENLKPDDRTLKPADLSADSTAIFDPDGSRKPVIDDKNAGYVHAPSINHALTAAVLRNAYISQASEAAAEPYKVNLSSERVRMALSIIEGLQQGQSLGALLGYHLERGLHDNTSEELDVFIYELRKVFPLVSNMLVVTAIKVGRASGTPEEAERNQEEEAAFSEEKAITKVEARNVVNGLSMLDHIRKTGVENYPFGLEIGEGPNKLRAANANERAAIDAEVKRLMNIRDAVADLAMAESVHQVVQGNYDRASGALDAYSKGKYPQMPDVIRSPGSGTSLTHRFGIHLPSGVVPAASDTPRAKAEPAINKWIEDLLPTDLSTLACLVEYRDPTYGETGANPVVQKTVSVRDLGLSPIDLLYMIDIETDKSLTAFDDRIHSFVHSDDTPRADIELEIKYAHIFDPASNILSIFELTPLIESLRALVVSSRPLMPADMAVPNEGRQALNATAGIDPARVATARQGVLDILSDLKVDVVDPLEPLIDDEDFEVMLGNKAALLGQADARIDDFITHLLALNRFGIPQSGIGFVYDRKRAIFAAVCEKVAEFRTRWRERQSQFEDLIAVDLPAATTDEERYDILQRAERLISTTFPVPRLPIPDYLTALGTKKGHFDNKLADLDTFISTNFPSLQSLLNAVVALKGDLGDFDLQPLEIEDEEKQILILIEDLFTQVGELIEAITQKMDEVQASLDEAAASANAGERVKLMTDAAKAIFGKDFQIVPEFTLNETQSSEVQKCLDDLPQLLNYQINVQSTDFPVDDWLYGVARIREKLAAWESLVVLAEAFKDRPPLDLTPIQLPYEERDHWLGLAYPEGLEITGDKLLYTAYLPVFNAIGPQCGLLVDEWTEVVPTKNETTGLTFHFDQPNSEPPQTMLLATPPAFTGEWQWNDVVKTMHETLDLARVRAIEPDHVDKTPYAPFLPATVAAVTALPITMTLNYLMPADLTFKYSGDSDG